MIYSPSVCTMQKSAKKCYAKKVKSGRELRKFSKINEADHHAPFFLDIGIKCFTFRNTFNESSKAQI